MANNLLTVDMITREAVALFTRENAFIQGMRADMAFVAGEQWPTLPPVSLPVAAAMGAAAVLIRNPPVTRRFWQWWK